MFARCLRLLFVAMLGSGFLLLTSTGGSANILEELVMPGPLIEGHAKYEKKCESCHEPFSKGSQAGLCLACHKDVAGDIQSNRGFHGKRSDVKNTECKHCHTDHKGRSQDIVLLDRETFDHASTDFPLLGAHATTLCAGCHEPGRKFRVASSACVDCHQSDDRHQGRLGKVCANCHEESSWAKTRFDHSEIKFALKGAHKEVVCKSCHAGEVYKGTPAQCNDCHRLNDAHGGRYGAKCATCHGTDKWKTIRFDHTRDTSFPLVGKHGKVECADCHTGDIYGQDLGTTCNACHKADDTHKGRNGPKCETCHNSNDWRQVNFNHDKSTKFPLTGRHAKLQCLDCHRGEVAKEALRTACVSCHQLADSHKGTAGQDCAACHTTSDWRKTSFNHDKATKFALRGKHAQVVCQGCHKGPDPKREKLGMACVDCHETDDVHKGQEGKNCAQCHNVEGWAGRVFFDHDLTRFPLIGLHATTPCEECHLSAAYKDTTLECAACHKADDTHEARLGPKCALCHNPNGWAFWRFDHGTQTDYPLTGVHGDVRCRACHTEAVEDEISLPNACVACHRKDDVHRGSFGSFCARCHVTESFDSLKQFQ